jgi:hypothetical protein
VIKPAPEREPEPRAGWYDKDGIADYFQCSKRWIELRMAEGMSHCHIAGHAKFKAGECERWLDEHGHIERKGDGHEQ